MTDVTFDTETTGLDMWYPGGGLDGEPARPFMVQWADDENPTGSHALLGPVAGRSRLAQRVAQGCFDEATRLVAHNLPFDVHQLNEGPGWDLLDGRRLADTDHLARIVWPGRAFPDETDLSRETSGYKLKDLTTDYVDPAAKDGQDELERLAKSHGFELKGKNAPPAAFYKLWQLEPEAMEFYAREDVRLTLGLLRVGESLLTEGTREIWRLEQAIAPIVIGAERQGICVDREKLQPLRIEYSLAAEAAYHELDAELADGWDQNNEVLADALLMHGVPLTERTESGQLATNQKALGAFVVEHPIIQELFDYRTKSKFVTTYLDKMDHDVIHPSFWQIGAKTGRMASANPNLQNVPTHAGPEIRQLYVPREGMAFCSIDFEQIELRLLAYYLHDAEIQDRVQNTDFFAWMASQTKANDGIVADEGYFRKGQPGEDWRTINKNATYAIVYGVGGLKLGRMLGWPADGAYTADDWVVKKGFKQAGDPRCFRAERLKSQVIQILRGYGKTGYRGPGSGSGLLGRISDKVAETGHVDTILGRHQAVGFDGAWKGLSALIQGGAADLFKLALEVSTPVATELGAYPLLFIHDEILWEAPADAAEEVLVRCGRAMAECYDLRPQLSVEGGYSTKSWGACK